MSEVKSYVLTWPGEAKPYVMTWGGGTADTDVDQETRITIYGPFASGKEAKDWGLNWGAEYDDPRWQLIMLSKENVRRDRDGPFLMVPLLSTV